MALLLNQPHTNDDLDAKYESVLNDQLEFGKLVTYSANKNQPVYGWFRFKEAFSPQLVTELLARQWLLPQAGLIL
ncbi:MAG TPA: hypothetical protein VFB90_03095, partial [Dehalococcoidia bacterium]|nr:hypothetical protein [Dehalococcoidia bacterium]